MLKKIELIEYNKLQITKYRQTDLNAIARNKYRYIEIDYLE